jgi:hypothetical protein
MSDGLGEGIEYESASFDDGSDEMLQANSQLDGALGERASVQGSAGEQLRQWLPTVPAADAIDEAEGTADQALAQAENITRDDAGKLLTQKQTMLDADANTTARIRQIGSDPALPETGGDETPTQIEQDLSGNPAARGALSAEERTQLAQRRDDLAANNPDDFESFSKDPDHFSKRAGYRVTNSSRDEAKTTLDLRDQGKLPPDVQRPAGAGEGDFYSPSQKQYFDIKEVNDTPPREFNSARAEQALRYQMLIGRTPIIDTSGASQSAIDQMAEVLERNGWESRVIWYP